MLEPYSLKYTVPYLLIFFAYTLLAFSKRRNSRTIRIISVLIFVLFVGFRGFVGWDWINYYPFFNELSFSNLSLSIDSFLENPIEPGFRLYSTTIKEIFDNWSIYVLISVIIDCVSLNHFFKRYSPNYPLSFLIYFCLCLGTQIDLLRNVKAIMLFLLGIDCIYSQNFKKYALIILLACFFHLSAIMFIFLYPLGRNGFSKNICLIIFIVSNIIYLLHVPFATLLIKYSVGTLFPILQLKLQAYSEGAVARGITLGYLIRVLISSLVFLRFNVMRKEDKGFFLSVYFIMTGFNLGFSDINTVAQRLEAILQPTICIIYPTLIATFKINWNRALINVTIFSYCLLCLVRSAHIAMYNYENILFGSSSYEERSTKDYNARLIIASNNE